MKPGLVNLFPYTLRSGWWMQIFLYFCSVFILFLSMDVLYTSVWTVHTAWERWRRGLNDEKARIWENLLSNFQVSAPKLTEYFGLAVHSKLLFQKYPVRVSVGTCLPPTRFKWFYSVPPADKCRGSTSIGPRLFIPKYSTLRKVNHKGLLAKPK